MAASDPAAPASSHLSAFEVACAEAMAHFSLCQADRAPTLDEATGRVDLSPARPPEHSEPVERPASSVPGAAPEPERLEQVAPVDFPGTSAPRGPERDEEVERIIDEALAEVLAKEQALVATGADDSKEVVLVDDSGEEEAKMEAAAGDEGLEEPYWQSEEEVAPHAGEEQEEPPAGDEEFAGPAGDWAPPAGEEFADPVGHFEPPVDDEANRGTKRRAPLMPPPPPPGDTRGFRFRGQRYRPLSGKWMNRGGRNREFFKAKYGRKGGGRVRSGIVQGGGGAHLGEDERRGEEEDDGGDGGDIDHLGEHERRRGDDDHEDDGGGGDFGGGNSWAPQFRSEQTHGARAPALSDTNRFISHLLATGLRKTPSRGLTSECRFGLGHN